MIDDDVLYKPITELSKMLRSRQLSPVELTRAYLSRIAALNPTLSAFATVTGEVALDDARRAESEIGAGKYRGPLHGIPYGAKDLVATKGIPTTWGARPYAGQMFDADAAIIRRLREAGAVLLGKLAMIELAGGLGYSKGDSSLTGAAHNPWGLDRWTCGSSSGSGAAVAAALVPFAIGSETWGSIICPSSFCGVSGLRPTFGRVSRRGAMALSWTLDKLGPMTRSARDCELVLERIQGHDPDDPYSADEKPAPPSDPGAVKSMRIAYLRDDFDKQGDKSVEKAFLAAIDDLKRAGVRLEEAKLPDLPFEAAAAVVLTAEVATAFEDLQKSGKARDLVSPDAPLSFVVARAVTGADFVKAQRVRTLCQKSMADLFATYDALLYPGEGYTAFPLDKDFNDIAWSDPVGAAGNLCGLPAIAVPCGFGADGMPVSLTAMTSAFEENKGISLARFFQGITSWHLKRPPLDRRDAPRASRVPASIAVPTPSS
ncbi:MAG TPA: amidase [Candidatus Polarisedimenticolia bacterium]|nr:amidase [Candidatus Polarisedimenticolia bacterium]